MYCILVKGLRAFAQMNTC